MRKISLFYSFEEMGRHMRADANAGALARLPAEALAEITARCGAVLAHFGYLAGNAAAELRKAAPVARRGVRPR